MPATFSATPIVRMNSLKALKSQSDDLRNGRTQHRDRALVSMDIDAGERCDRYLAGEGEWTLDAEQCCWSTKTNWPTRFRAQLAAARIGVLDFISAGALNGALFLHFTLFTHPLSRPLWRV